MDETSATTASPTAAGSLPAGDARADIVARVRGMSGEIRPQFARGQTFSWGVYVIDAQTGDVNGLNAGGESWPPYFDALPGQKP